MTSPREKEPLGEPKQEQGSENAIFLKRVEDFLANPNINPDAKRIAKQNMNIEMRVAVIGSLKSKSASPAQFPNPR